MTSPAENIVVNIPRLEGMTFLFSNVFGVWMFLNNFGAVFFGRNIIGIKLTANAVFVAFRVVCRTEKGRILYGLVKTYFIFYIL